MPRPARSCPDHPGPAQLCPAQPCPALLSRRGLGPVLFGGLAGLGLVGWPATGLAGEPSQGSNRNEEASFGRVDLRTPARRLVPRGLVIAGAGEARELDLRAGLPRYREDRLSLVDLSRLPLLGALLRAPLADRFAGAVPAGRLHLSRDRLVLIAERALPAPQRIVILHREISWETRRAPRLVPAHTATAPDGHPVGTGYRHDGSGEWLLIVHPAILGAPA